MAEVPTYEDCLPDSRYCFHNVGPLGVGSFGTVRRAIEKRGRRVEVAYKFIRTHSDVADFKDGFPTTILYEIAALKSLNHPNIIKLLDVEYIPVPGEPREPIIGLVFNLAQTDLAKYMKGRDLKKKNTFGEIKIIMYQLLEAVHHIHSRGFIHRDLKPANVLIWNDGDVLVGDFGHAHQLSDYMSVHVTTVQYRSPELAFGKSKYTFATDVWSIGCIFAELIIGHKLFEIFEDRNSKLIAAMQQTLGDPVDDPASENYLPGVSEHELYRECRKRPFNDVKRDIEIPLFDSAGTMLRGVFDTVGKDLLYRMLTYDPASRITCKGATEHPWFADRDKSPPL